MAQPMTDADRAELEQWRTLSADVERILRAQIAQRVSVMSTESKHADLKRERDAEFGALLMRLEMLRAVRA